MSKINLFLKIMLIFGVFLIIVSGISYFFLSDYKSNNIDKEMMKRALFCEGKVGFVEYKPICNKFGECTQQILFCDYLNYLREHGYILKDIDINYQKIEKEFNTNFAINVSG